MEIIILLILFAVFGFVGILLFKLIPDNMDKKQSRCTQSVLARIVDVKVSTSSDSGDWYAPVFEFCFSGMMYRKAPNVYTDKKPVIGTELKLLINPYNPNIFIDPERNMYIKRILKIIGMGMLSADIIVIIIAVAIIIGMLN